MWRGWTRTARGGEFERDETLSAVGSGGSSCREPCEAPGAVSAKGVSPVDKMSVLFERGAWCCGASGSSGMETMSSEDRHTPHWARLPLSSTWDAW